MPVLVVCLLALTCTVYAAPSATMKSTQPAKTATGTTSSSTIKYDPNAPPQGTITITSPQSGKTWYTGSYQVIQWTCNGTRSNLVDVTLWKSNQEVAIIWPGADTGRTAYIVPFGTAAGNYELRVTSQDDTRVEARQPVTIAPTTVTLATPPGALFAGSRYTINWSYTGNPVVKLVILDSSGAVLEEVRNITTGSNGKGSWPWPVHAPPSGKSSVQCRFQIVGTFKTSVTSNATADIVLGTSGLFAINLPTIRVLPFDGIAAGAPVYTDLPYTIKWVNEMSGGAVKVELYSLTNSTLAQTIQASVGIGASNVGWSPPGTLPANLYGTSFQIRVTSLDLASVQGVSAPFTIQKPQPVTIYCPSSEIIRALFRNIAPSGWSAISEGSIQYNGYTILTDALSCKYRLQTGNTSVPFIEIKHALPNGYTCSRSAGYGAKCVPK